MPRLANHFYTTSESEKNIALGRGYQDEGIACYVFRTQAAHTIPLFRLYKGQVIDDFYTISPAERNSSVATYGYTALGVSCYVYDAQWGNSIPLYRLFHEVRVDHFYTIDRNDFDNARSYGYRDEGIACYVHGKREVNTVPLYRLYKDDDKVGAIFYSEDPVTDDLSPKPQANVAELVCTGSWAQPSGLLRQNTPFTIWFTISNMSGVNTGDFTVRLELDGGIQKENVTIRLAANSSDNVYWNFSNGLSKGSHYIYAYIDANDRVLERREDNNIAYYGIIIS